MIHGSGGRGMSADRDVLWANAGAIVVMGVSGSGKSTLGALLAARFGSPFIEGDTLHAPESVAKMRAGQPLQDADRWPWLDRVGVALRESLAVNGTAVAACSALRFSYRERLRTALAAPLSFLLLSAGREELLQRMAARPHHFMPASLLDSQLATLEPPRQGERILLLDASASPESLCEASCAWLAPSQGRVE